MQSKKIFLTTLVGICVVFLALAVMFGNSGSVSADITTDKISNKTYIDSLRNNDSVEVIGNVLKTYDADTEIMTFSDDKGVLVQMKLLTPVEDNKVSPNDMTKPVARFSIPEHRDGAKFIDKTTAYDIDSGYTINPKSFVWKYLVKENITEFYTSSQINNETGINETIEKNYTYVNESWVAFNDWKQLPAGENEIGVFTTAILGEHIEFVFQLEGFEVLEYASYLVTDLISYYKLDENAANTTVTDSHGSNDGIASTNTANLYDASGVFNSAFDLPGASDYVYLTGVTTGTSSTIAMWVYVNTYDDGGPGGRDYLIDIQSGRTLISLNNVGQLSYYNGGFIDFGAKFSASAWHYVVLTLDAGSTTAKMYVDGSQFGTDKAYSPVNIGGTITLGSQYETKTSDNLNAKIDEVAIYSSALNSTAVGDLHQAGLDGVSYPFDYPVSCTFSGYVFDGDSNALVGANVTIWNQYNVSEYYENTTITGGAWSMEVPNSTNTYMSGAYYNNTLIGQLKPYISGSC